MENEKEQIMGIAKIIEPFSEEYNKLLEYKKIPKAAIKKMPHQGNIYRD